MGTRNCSALNAGESGHISRRGVSLIVFLEFPAGTWGIFSSYGRDGPSKLLFVQQRQDSCLVRRDTSGISLRLGRAIGTLLEARRESQGLFLVARGILLFLSIFKRSQASSPFKH